MPNCGNKSWTTVYKLSTEKINSFASNGFQAFHALFHAFVSNVFEHKHIFGRLCGLHVFFLNVSFVFFGHGFWLEFVGEYFFFYTDCIIFSRRTIMQDKTCKQKHVELEKNMQTHGKNIHCSTKHVKTCKKDIYV